jgi:site-specific DNA-methyltransferase (adenine-specific)
MEVNQVYNQDCLAGMRCLGDGCVQLAFADPPFNIGYDYDVYDDRKPRDRYLAWTRAWIAEVVRVLTPTGTFWLAIGDEYAAEAKLITQSLGLTCRSWVIWYYTFGVHCKRKFTRSHAHLFHFVRDPKRFTFNAAAVRVPSARQLVYADKRADPAGRLPDDTWMLPPSVWTYRPQDLSGSFRPDEDTWYFPRVCGTFRQRVGWHGCQMPEQLLARIIRVSSDVGDLVLDPFGGSGTTYAVAKKLGRRWLGFELSPQYVRLIRERLERIRPGDPLEGAEDPLVTAPPTRRGRGSQTEPQEAQGRSGRRNGRARGTQCLWLLPEADWRRRAGRRQAARGQ